MDVFCGDLHCTCMQGLPFTDIPLCCIRITIFNNSCVCISTGEFTELFVGKAKQFKFNHKFQPGSQTLFRVRARNSVGWSDYSDEMTHNVGQAAPGVPPSPSLSSQTSQSLTLNWTPPPGPAPVSSFCLEMDDPNTVSAHEKCPIY